VNIHPPSPRSQLASSSCNNATKESGPLVSSTSDQPTSEIQRALLWTPTPPEQEREDDARPSRGSRHRPKRRSPPPLGNPRPPQEKETSAPPFIRDHLRSSLPRHLLLDPPRAPFPWPIQPRSPPPFPARWRPGRPSRPLSTPGPEPAPSSDRARSTGCVLGRGRTIRRTSTGPTHGTSPWISPLGSVSSPADSAPPILRLQATVLDSPFANVCYVVLDHVLRVETFIRSLVIEALIAVFCFAES
jgi:hypothetical protein